MMTDSPSKLGGDVKHLPPPQRHVLDAAVITLANPETSMPELHKKTCKNCGAVRVTVIGANIVRLWQLADGQGVTGEPRCEAADALRVPA